MLAREDQQLLLLIDVFVRAGTCAGHIRRHQRTGGDRGGVGAADMAGPRQPGRRRGEGAIPAYEVLRRPKGLGDRMLKLLTLGFEVRELMGGLDWWKRDGYATEGARTQAGTEIVCGC